MLTTVVITTMLLTARVNAQPPPTLDIYAWTDKPSYNLGEQGVLTIVVRNDRTDQVILENVTIEYPWFAYLGDKWDGNDTIVASPLPLVLSVGNSYKTTVRFTVPTDGRLTGTTSSVSSQIAVVVSVKGDSPPYEYTSTPSIYVKAVPFYMSIQDMNNILMLFTVLVILIIVCTVIIAATIVLSKRKPK